MVISNFKILNVTGKGLSQEFIAEVDVTTTKWFRKKTKRVKVHRKAYMNWVFADTGKYTPGLDVEQLEKAASINEHIKNNIFKED